MLIIIACSSSISAASYTAVLAKYNVTGSVANILVPVQLSMHGDNYTLLYLHGNPYMLSNDTNGTLVFGSSEAFSVAGSYIISQGLNSSYIGSAKAAMQNYESSSSTAINECAQITGLAGTIGVSFTCTLANGCESCTAIPACKKVLVKTGGPSEAFGLGIAQFETQYANLTSDYAEFYTAISTISPQNAETNLAELQGAFSGISSITRSIYQNPVFPPTANVSGLFGQCRLPANLSQFSNFSLKNAPWFCNAIGYCPLTTYNYSALGSISSLISSISTLPITNSTASKVTANLSNNDYSYYEPILYRQKGAEYAKILNTTLLGYAKLINESESLSAHISNYTFITALAVLQKSYANLSANYVNINLTAYNKTLSLQLKNLTNAYVSSSVTYSSIKTLAAANTRTIITYQLDSNPLPQKLAALTFSQYSINNQIASKVNNTKSTYASLQSINASLHTLSPNVPFLPELVRASDSGIVTSIEAGLSASYASKVAAAPYYAALISLIIGLILLGILFIEYRRLNARHKIHMKPRARKNWRIIFGLALLFLMIYVASTYYYAASANTFTPVSAFLSSAGAAKATYIISNGSSSGIANCSKSISAAMLSKGKEFTAVNVSSAGLCSISGFVGNVSSCIDHITAAGSPVILLSIGNSSSIKAYSFYGSSLSVSGSPSFMNECIPAELLG